jgi:Helix-hairpin-helix motif
MDTETLRRARASLVLASLLLALALARPAPPPADCEAPGERRAVAGHSVELACASPVPGRPVRGPVRRLVGLPIDPNAADAATLETLPGVGPARARAILEARERRPFRRVEDLERVPGIGPRTLAGIAGFLGIGGRSESATPPPLAPPARTR